MGHPAVRVVPLHGEVDPLHLAGDDGVLFESPHRFLAGRGEAFRVEEHYEQHGLQAALGTVMQKLLGLATEGDVAPFAFVTIPFVPTRPLLAIVPTHAVVKTGNGAPRMIVIGDEARTSLPDAIAAVAEPPTSFAVRPSRSAEAWRSSVREAVRRIQAGELAKVVLAREVIVEADAPISQVGVIEVLRRIYPSAYRFAIDGLLGASPELLIERLGRSVTSIPIAGTAARMNDRTLDEQARHALLASEKNQAEHRYLSQMVTETLERHCSELRYPASPSVMSLANVHHLVTEIHGTLADDATTVLDLLSALHPTPAVGGRPTDVAVRTIAELEQLDRGRYAGAVGWVDANGDGQFAIAIRCAQLEGERARLWAGNGIVANSDADLELEETQWKMQAMLGAIVRP